MLTMSVGRSVLGLFVLLAARCIQLATCIQVLEAGVPMRATLASGATQRFRFRSCSGTEGFSVTLRSLFGNADLYGWNQHLDLTEGGAFSSSLLPSGDDTIVVAPLLGHREYAFGAKNSGFYSAVVEITVTWDPNPLRLGIDARLSANDGCNQYFSVDMSDIPYDELVRTLCWCTDGVDCAVD